MNFEETILNRRRSISALAVHAAHYLPAQGPLSSFIHHNPLHAFEGQPFAEGLSKAAEIYGCEPYFPEDRYREELERGRILEDDLEAVLRLDLGARSKESPCEGLDATRIELRSALLRNPVRLASDDELNWLVSGSDALTRFRLHCEPAIRDRLVSDTRQWVMRDFRESQDPNLRAQSLASDLMSRFGEKSIEHWPAGAWVEITLTLLWRICRRGMMDLPFNRPDPPRTPARPRDRLLSATGIDPDRKVNETLARFCSVFADQGLAEWEPPGKGGGFLKTFARLYGPGRVARSSWMESLPGELRRLEEAGVTAEQSIEESLRIFGVTEERREAFVLQSLLALRGWAGMLWRMESCPDRVIRPVPRGTLLEFLAVRLILDRLAAAHVAGKMLGYRGLLANLQMTLFEKGAATAASTGNSADYTLIQKTYLTFLLAQSLGWKPRVLSGLTRGQWASMIREIESFPSLERRRIFHLAYERRYRTQTFDALTAHARQPRRNERPSLQVVFCIDEREESFRRHLEEIAPSVETFGAAGFFGVAMYYRGMREAHETALCPVNIRPAHRVRERPSSGETAKPSGVAALARRLTLTSARLRSASRGFCFGMIVSALGALAAVPLAARVMFPRWSSKLRGRARAVARTETRTELALERGETSETDENRGAPGISDGFTTEEMAGIVERVLRDIGMIGNFARLAVMAGHGSSSLNNPHEAAHDCGACGGGRGGPNARAFARMANHPAVRRRLAEKGIDIPGDTVFLGACHNTCDEGFEFYDLHNLPETHQVDFRWARRTMHRARLHNAHERCRRFFSAPLDLTLEGALRHVEGRAEDLAQTRPEFGHASNAVCVVGRRARTRGLFMDRRAFLVSYDPDTETDDPERPILTRILEAVIPVCGGINLEYFFSTVDPSGWGCGTKLPHNIASLLGVMDGALSDLRPGLPWQMVEIHEPMRLLLIVETDPGVLERILSRHESLREFCRNEWIQLAALRPDGHEVLLYQGGTFVRHEPEFRGLPNAASSMRWYSGLREHLGFASVNNANDLDPALQPKAAPPAAGPAAV